MDNRIDKILGRFGLTEQETSLYLASLSLGEADMTTLTKRAGVNRSTGYLLFKNLEKKGLLGSFVMRKKLRVVPTQPELLYSRAQNDLGDLQALLPELKALSEKEGGRPKIRYYSGKEGYITALEESLQKPNTTLRHIGSISEAHEVYEEYDMKHFMPTRIKRNILIKSLYFPSFNEELKNRDHAKELREIKYLSEEFHADTAKLICDDRVIITSSKKELVAVVIESNDIAESERQYFDLIWSLTK